ncbi:MAG: agmatine deiminase family protein [Chitinophagaceae bacterium]|nr:agmatine deiminase family protein [Chitinophagaceae bacterium]
MQNLIIIPIYDKKEDAQVVKQFEILFPSYTIRTIDCNEIAIEGGILNCISWNVYKSKNY